MHKKTPTNSGPLKGYSKQVIVYRHSVPVVGKFYGERGAISKK
jgi:hypothetical protein